MSEPLPNPAHSPPASGSLFPDTAWTLVQRAVADGEKDALNQLFERYWQPIYIYLRRSGRPVAEAEDLTQAYFAHLLEKQLLKRVRPRQVRFRAYLRSVLEHFLANEARKAGAQKRRCLVTLDVTAAESWLQAGSPTESPATAFDSAWAMERLESALGRLRRELVGAGREWVADALMQRVGLGGTTVPLGAQELSRRYGVTANQLSVALYRARQRLRDLILEEIRDSVGSDEEAVEELGDLFRVLRQRGGE